MSNKIRLRSFILSLPGPLSYCDCQTPCSRLELEHVLPKSVLKRSLSGKTFQQANKNPHNLLTCCRPLNQEKSNLVLAINYDSESHNGRLARACLYMNDFYQIGFDTEIVTRWKNFSLLYPADREEYLRNSLIYDKTGLNNKYIDLV